MLSGIQINMVTDANRQNELLWEMPRATVSFLPSFELDTFSQFIKSSVVRTGLVCFRRIFERENGAWPAKCNDNDLDNDGDDLMIMVTVRSHR